MHVFQTFYYNFLFSSNRYTRNISHIQTQLSFFSLSLNFYTNRIDSKWMTWRHRCKVAHLVLAIFAKTIVKIYWLPWKIELFMKFNVYVAPVNFPFQFDTMNLHFPIEQIGFPIFSRTISKVIYYVLYVWCNHFPKFVSR